MAVPQLITITGKLTKKDGTPESGTVTFRQLGFVRSAISDEVISPGSTAGTLDSSGNLSMPVSATDDANWTPQGWTYKVIIDLSTSYEVLDVQVPAASPGGIFDMGDILPAVPNAGDQYAPIAHTHSGGGGGTLNPGNTVSSETSYGASASAGSSVDYSRTDHTHGSPTAPTAASVGASPTSHNHSGTYDPAGSAATALSSAQSYADTGDNARQLRSVLTAKGDLYVATASNTVARLGVGSNTQLLTADSTQATGVKWADPPTGGGAADGNSVFPLSHWGFLAATGNPEDFMSKSTYTNGTVFYSRMWIPSGVAITNLWVAVTDAGVHDGATTPNQLSVYDDAGTLLLSTANDNTLWTTVGWRGGALVGGPIASQGTGRFVYVSAIPRGMNTPAAIAYNTTPNDYAFQWIGPGQTKRRTFYSGGLTAPAATVNPASTGTPTGYTPLFAVS